MVKKDPIPIDMEVAKMLEKFNINVDYAVRCLENNKHNHATTTYYLLL